MSQPRAQAISFQHLVGLENYEILCQNHEITQLGKNLSKMTHRAGKGSKFPLPLARCSMHSTYAQLKIP